jgi:hypothetical protein
MLVGASGFEPEASCAQGRRATRLRYAPTYETSILTYFRDLPTRSIEAMRDIIRN